MAPELADSLVLGLGASLIMDGWALLRQYTTRTPMLDYGWIARWVAGLPSGRMSVVPGQGAPLSKIERSLGWMLHYAIGAAYAGVFLSVAGPLWLESPSVWPALAFGAVTSLAPFLILQPALGRGVFANRTPAPRAARVQTLLTHLVFGAGLYGTALGLLVLRS